MQHKKNTGFWARSQNIWGPLLLLVLTIGLTALAAAFAPSIAFVVLIVMAIISIVVSILRGWYTL